MGATMTNYRLYPLDKSGRFLGAVEFLASDDSIAREIADRTAQGQPCELWEGARLVLKVKSQSLGTGSVAVS